MSSAPYFRLYFSDLAGDTLHLSDAEMGSYVLLIGAMWNAGGRLDPDEESLARIARCPADKWARRWSRLERFFETDSDGSICHKRVTQDREERARISGERSEAGKAGAKAKSLKNNKAIKANASAAGKQTGKQTPSKTQALPESIVEGDDKSSPRTDEVREAFDAFNRMAERCGLAKAEALTDGRRKAIRARLKEQGFSGWQKALNACAKSPHCRGKNDRAWKADIDFICQPKSFTRLLEGFYGTGETVPPDPSAPAPPKPVWSGPTEIRDEAVLLQGEPWTVAWLDRCRWQDVPAKAIIAPNGLVAERINLYLRDYLRKLGVAVILEEASAA